MLEILTDNEKRLMTENDALRAKIERVVSESKKRRKAYEEIKSFECVNSMYVMGHVDGIEAAAGMLL